MKKKNNCKDKRLKNNYKLNKMNWFAFNKLLKDWVKWLSILIIRKQTSLKIIIKINQVLMIMMKKTRNYYKHQRNLPINKVLHNYNKNN